MPMDFGCPIVYASCADPYVVLLTEDGQVILLTLKEQLTRGSARLHAQSADLLYVREILFSISLFLLKFNLFDLYNLKSYFFKFESKLKFCKYIFCEYFFFFFSDHK